MNRETLLKGYYFWIQANAVDNLDVGKKATATASVYIDMELLKTPRLTPIFNKGKKMLAYLVLLHIREPCRS